MSDHPNLDALLPRIPAPQSPVWQFNLDKWETGALQSEREWFDPVAWLVARGADCSHITLDPSVVPEFRIIRQTTHDGTMMFTEEVIARALAPLADQTVHFKGTEPADWSNVRGMRYTVGLARRAVVFGRVDLPAGRYPGQRERITVPVRCEYVYSEDA